MKRLWIVFAGLMIAGCTYVSNQARDANGILYDDVAFSILAIGNKSATSRTDNHEMTYALDKDASVGALEGLGLGLAGTALSGFQSYLNAQPAPTPIPVPTPIPTPVPGPSVAPILLVPVPGTSNVFTRAE